jgi:4-oxalocrotonate tautomerase
LKERKIDMPFVQIKLIEGVFSGEQKRQILNKVTEAMLSVEGENMRQVTSVIIEEVKSGDWAMGGKPLETDDVKALAAGKQGKAA